MRKMKSLLLFALCFTAGYGLMLPSYIKRCSLSDANVKECILKNGNNAIPSIIKGDKSLKIPSMTPLTIPELTLTNSKNFMLTLRKAVIEGLQTGKLIDAGLSSVTKSINLTLTFDHITVDSEYEVKGNIMLLKIEGVGHAHVVITKPTIMMTIWYEEFKKGNDIYIKTKDSFLDFSEERTSFDLTNLFNGNEQLGKQMNNFLNENYRDIANDLRPSLQDAINAIVTNLINSISNEVKLEDLFLK